MPRSRAPRCLAATLSILMVAAPLAAVVQPEETPLRARIFRHDDLSVPTRLLPAGEAEAAALATLGVAPQGAYVDGRTGGWATLMPARPLLPGAGVGNSLTWEDFGLLEAPDGATHRRLAWEAFVGYLSDHRQTLGIDLGELTRPGHVTVHDGGRLVQIHAPRQVGGIPVRDSYLSAVVRHGNLVLLGATHWAEMTAGSQPLVSADQAMAAVQAHLAGTATASGFDRTHLAFVPAAAEDALAYRLAWVLRPQIDGDLGTWEALVDAGNGELLAFDDLNHYASTREVEGGVFPESNDGMGPEGTEQADYPMPFADLTIDGETFITDAGGNLPICVDGDVTTALSGQYMHMADLCGPISESTGGDVLDLGMGPGTDCAVPPGASPGNTHSSRSGFYEMNRIKEMARGQLPDNVWLTQTLTANMNINNTCNAFWSGSVNFFRSGGGCANTGELAGVYDHEWGHGMDDNDANPSIAGPSGEGIADLYAALRLNTSCIGRGFRLGDGCGGYGDPCVGSPPCDGVRDIDYLKRLSGLPHTYTWSNANCGGGVHCVGAVYSEAVWSLWKRKLQEAPYNLASDTAHEIVTRLTYLGGGAVGTWFSGGPPFGGCGANGGYLNFLAADDDDGDLANGTPHMEAIFDAFDDQEIACATPTVQDSGCAGTPTSAPTVTAAGIDRGVHLTWDPVAGASSYQVYRTDGVFGCDFGKILATETEGTEFVDSGLKNGRDYSYTVIAKGPDAACFGPASSCATVAPVPGAAIGISPQPGSLGFLNGDGDGVLDNCEQLEVGIVVSNTGAEPLTNVRIVSIERVSHPILVLSELPVAVADSIDSCSSGEGLVVFEPSGLDREDRLSFRVEVTSDEIAPDTRSQIVEVDLPTEVDHEFFASRTFSFETDLENWNVVQGTFDRTGGGGGDGTTFSVDSSAFLDDVCDEIRSPAFSLSATSTVTLWNNYDIQGRSGGSWFDRANVGLVDSDGNRTVINSDGGRPYNADDSGPGVFSGCNGTEDGWAGNEDTWGTSSWSTAALDAAGHGGRPVRLDVVYASDNILNRRGFWFDQVTVTDFNLQIDDVQSDVCASSMPIFLDGFETGDTSQWTVSTP